ncbi:DUF1203 domain-containing protein [Streptomyces chumphonensis]|uniref:DUF1203 domain-containing protein n=1 Tax=Streptomyces chumphonensis TaxID=1214925 RepID=UPI003D7148F6
MTTYTALPIPDATLTALRERDDAGHRPRPVTADEGGEPLRCCLRRARPGERVVLLAYAPLRRWAARTGAEPGPYDEQGPVFVHAAPCPGPDPGAVGYPFSRPGALRCLRRYDAAGRIAGGRLLTLPEDPLPALDAAFAEAFALPGTALVHVRAVEYGCFHYAVTRP